MLAKPLSTENWDIWFGIDYANDGIDRNLQSPIFVFGQLKSSLQPNYIAIEELQRRSWIQEKPMMASPWSMPRWTSAIAVEYNDRCFLTLR